jgi:type IV fimbrial biogenesis protein FimT
MRSCRRPRGITLHELVVALAIAAVAAMIAVTGTESMVQRASLRSAAAEVASDLQHARTLAVTGNQTLRVGFHTFDDGGSCYAMYRGAVGACQCTAAGQSSCSGGAEVLRMAYLPPAGRVRVQANVGTMTYDPRLGTASPAGRIEVVGRDGRSLRHVVSLMGRVRTCSPGGTVSGVPVCAPG